MALLFVDSFDHYTTYAQLELKWTENVGQLAPVAAVGRNSTYGLRCPLNSASYISKAVPNYATYIVGRALYLSTLTLNSPVGIEFLDSVTAQVGVYVNSSTGTLSVRRGGSAGTVLATSAASLGTSAWYFLELKATIHDTAGLYEVRINGNPTPWIIGSGANTRSSANNYANLIRIYEGRLDSQSTGDDVYICDNQGARNNDFLGDVRVAAILPNGAGTYSEWAASAGANYTCVDDSTPNNDTDYVATSGAGYRDTYNFASLPVASGTILGIQTVAFARKDDAGARAVAALVYYNSTLYSGGVNYVGDTYQFYPTIFETNPNTSARWTVPEINAAEFGNDLAA